MTAFSYTADWFPMSREVHRIVRRNVVLASVLYEIASRVRHQPGGSLTDSHGVLPLEVGQAVIGRDELAKLLNITPRKVRTALDRLATLGILTIETTNRGTIVTLCGFAESRASTGTERPTDRPATGQRPASDRPATDH